MKDKIDVFYNIYVVFRGGKKCTKSEKMKKILNKMRNK